MLNMLCACRCRVHCLSDSSAGIQAGEGQQPAGLSAESGTGNWQAGAGPVAAVCQEQP
jgi:hypothetical protein